MLHPQRTTVFHVLQTHDGRGRGRAEPHQGDDTRVREGEEEPCLDQRGRDRHGIVNHSNLDGDVLRQTNHRGWVSSSCHVCTG